VRPGRDQLLDLRDHGNMQALRKVPLLAADHIALIAGPAASVETEGDLTTALLLLPQQRCLSRPCATACRRAAGRASARGAAGPAAGEAGAGGAGGAA
jgi:hypothetical protein